VGDGGVFHTPCATFPDLWKSHFQVSQDFKTLKTWMSDFQVSQDLDESLSSLSRLE
jgi:hypothetical protein